MLIIKKKTKGKVSNVIVELAKRRVEKIPSKPGVYAILCEINNKVYIGKGDLYSRKATHWSLLKSNRHYNKDLQRDWNKIGAESFRFVILFETQGESDLDYLNECEEYWIGLTMSTNKKYGYNYYKKPGFQNSFVIRIESL